VDYFGGGHGSGGSMTPAAEVTGQVTGLAAGDFSAVADSFSNAGFTVRLPARGILQISAAEQPGQRMCLLLSAGIHGDETAPVEILEQLLRKLAVNPHILGVDLLVVIGHPAAIALGRRYVEFDLNRMFVSDSGEPVRGAPPDAETQRAAVIMRATHEFFAKANAGRWHLDLHTAIRASHFPTFAIVPDLGSAEARRELIDWLGDAGIGAVVLNTKPSGTFSAWTAAQFGALSCTAELGRIAPLGKNDLSKFAVTQTALQALLTGGAVPKGRRPQHFVVAQEIIKASDGFYLLVTRDATNFMPMGEGDPIAEDGDHVWEVRAETEFLLFANQDVAIGQRAALMVVPV